MAEESPPKGPREDSKDDLEMHLQFLLDPFGDESHQYQRDRSLQVLLARADEAHPRLLAALRENPTALDAPAIIEVLPLFGRPESIPLLAEILSLGHPSVSRFAGMALGRHPDAAAGEALRQGMESASPEVLMGAADGLMVRGDRSACPALLPVLGHPNADVRYHVVHAAVRLDCLEEDALQALESGDPDPDIRDLVRKLRAESGGS